MFLRKINWETELKKLARGQKTTVDVPSIARFALSCVTPTLREHEKHDDVARLERLFKLEDPR
jgi:hypothetical protein